MLEFAIVVHVLLDCVVCEVDFNVVNGVGFEAVGGRARPDIALPIEVHFHFVVEQHPYSDIEFASVDQKRFLKIFLDYEGTASSAAAAEIPDTE